MPLCGTVWTQGKATLLPGRNDPDFLCQPKKNEALKIFSKKNHRTERNPIKCKKKKLKSAKKSQQIGGTNQRTDFFAEQLPSDLDLGPRPQTHLLFGCCVVRVMWNRKMPRNFFLDRHNQPANKRLHGMVQAASIETHNQDTKQTKHSPACQNTWNIQRWLQIIRATVAKAVLAETPCALKQPKVEQTESQQSAVHRFWRDRAFIPGSLHGSQSITSSVGN